MKKNLLDTFETIICKFFGVPTELFFEKIHIQNADTILDDSLTPWSFCIYFIDITLGDPVLSILQGAFQK